MPTDHATAKQALLHLIDNWQKQLTHMSQRPTPHRSELAHHFRLYTWSLLTFSNIVGSHVALIRHCKDDRLKRAYTQLVLSLIRDMKSHLEKHDFMFSDVFRHIKKALQFMVAHLVAPPSI